MRLRLSTLLVLLNLTALSAPFVAFYFLKTYDSGLVRQTERELLAQSAAIGAAFRDALNEQGIGTDYGTPSERFEPSFLASNPGIWLPEEANLSLSDTPILPPSEPQRSNVRADPIAFSAGQQFSPFLRGIQMKTLAGLRVLDYQGIVVSSTGFDVGSDLSGREEVSEALRGQTGRALRSRDHMEEKPDLASISRSNRFRVHVAYPIIREDRVVGVVYSIRTPKTAVKDLYEKNNLLFVVGGIFSLVIGLAMLASLSLSLPIRALVRQAENVIRGNQKGLQPLKHPITKDFEILSNTMSELANTLARRAGQIKSFASSISHEFKTPITSISGAVSILQDHEGELSVEQRQQFLHNISEDVTRMNQLINQLLMLTRADVVKSPAASSDLAAAIQRATKRYEPNFEGIHAYFSRKGALVDMPEELLDSVIINLFHNAMLYGGDKLEISVHILNKQVEMIFSDNGDGIAAENREKIFKPFYTTGESRGGTGLGLPIVATLLKNHGGNIELLESTGGATFRLIFARAAKASIVEAQGSEQCNGVRAEALTP
ncbi:sensor histidine kinase [Biformimicrobium ophioploci]|uniref:histidine kinase n=1 Tax=Biformimicrobium ophioploci TaxID=3036711 RepID=A0ABQ6M0R0_9GAMM|nr:ATP-binding protein [Microbulbifer sp. NKW57]GMG87908.1 ATP-binding protein [Microbulbifer sp. NKW57]